MKEKIKEKIQYIFANIISEEFFIVNCTVSSNERNPLIVVLVDGDKGITIDKCAEISRVINKELETFEIPNYTLEVSSPGIDYPLQFKRQYIKNIGRKLKVLTNEGMEIKGQLKKVEENFILIETPSKEKGKKKELKEIQIELSAIKKAHVLLSF